MSVLFIEIAKYYLLQKYENKILTNYLDSEL